MTTFALTRPEYAAVWQEEQNATIADGLRALLQHRNDPQVLIVQPGDGTRYRFLLAPAPTIEYEVSDNGRHPQQRESPSPCALLVTVLDGLGNGTCSILSRNGIDGIRHRIAEKMEIRNPCTAEALAQTILAVWGNPDADG